LKSAYDNQVSESDPTPYSSAYMLDYSDKFVATIDARYTAEIRDHLAWYLENSFELLLNVNYPSRAEKEFLRHVELWQQEKNDNTYCNAQEEDARYV